MSPPAFTFTNRAVPFVQIGIGDSRTDIGAAQWDIHRWDDPTATWAGAEPQWLDVTCDAYSIETEVGRQRTTDAFAPGTLALTMSNASGWADPDPPGTDPAILSMRAGRAIRIGVIHQTLGVQVLWRGFIDRSEPRYDPVGGETVDLTCIDALGEVGRVPLPALADPGVGADELAGNRITRILNAAKWPASKRQITATGVACIATTFDAQAADLLSQTADSAAGSVFGDVAGRIVFHGQDWQVYDPVTPNDGTIGNTGGSGSVVVNLAEDPAGSGLYDPGVHGFTETPAGSGLYNPDELKLMAPGAAGLYQLHEVVEQDGACPSSWILSSDREDIITQVMLARVTDDVPLVWDNAKGQGLYGIETYDRDDLVCRDSAQMTTIANRIFRTRGYTVTPRVERVDLDAATSSQALDLIAVANPFKPSRYRCHLELDRGVIFDYDMFVTGVRHTITPDAWLCSLDLDWAAPYASSAARWDGDRWDQSAWATSVLADAFAALDALEAA